MEIPQTDANRIANSADFKHSGLLEQSDPGVWFPQNYLSKT